MTTEFPSSSDYRIFHHFALVLFPQSPTYISLIVDVQQSIRRKKNTVTSYFFIVHNQAQ